LLARFVDVLVSIVVLIIVAGILLALLKANPTNSVVSEVHGWGRWLTGPFDGMFSFHRARVAVAVNWGIAAVLYLFAGALVARPVSSSPQLAPTRRALVDPQSGGFMTSKNIDTAIGRVKEALGALTGNKRLKDEGRVDQAKGSVKNAVDKVADVLADNTSDHTQN
jgi:uncharacterized protein YjbJ (UPF0337 family)